jgi:hypothetical protein
MLLQDKWIISRKTFEHLPTFALLKKIDEKVLHAIQFAFIMNLIQIKLTNVTCSMKNMMIQEFQ